MFTRPDQLSRLPALFVVVTLAFSFVSGGCKSAPETEPEMETREHVDKPAFSAFAHVEERAQWLPPDARLLAVADASYTWEFVGQLIPQKGAEREAQVSALRKELGSIWTEELQIDFVQARSAIVAGTADKLMLILDGDFEPPRQAEIMQMHGKTVYRVVRPFEGMFRPGLMQMMAGRVDAWVVMLEEPSGVAIFLDQPSIDAATRRAANPEASLAQSERLDEFRRLFDRVPDARVVVAGSATGSDMGAPDQPGEPATAEDAVFALGDAFEASFMGGGDALDDIEAEISRNIEELRARSVELRRQARDQSAARATAGAMVHYITTSYFDALQVERTDTALTFRLPLPESQSSALLAAASALGLADWLQAFGPPTPQPPVPGRPEQPGQPGQPDAPAPSDQSTEDAPETAPM